MFDYTSKRIVTTIYYNKKIEEEIDKLNLLGSFKNSPRIKYNRPIGNSDIYEEDSILKIPNLGKKTADKLKELGVETIADMKELPADNISDLKDLGIRLLESILSSTDSSVTGAFLYTTTGHRKENKSYISTYGSEWESVISKTVKMSPYISITSLVTYIIDESTRTMEGTRYQDD